MLGLPLVFFFEVVSRPHREENRLFRLLEERDRAWVCLRIPPSVLAATCPTQTIIQKVNKHLREFQAHVMIILNHLAFVTIEESFKEIVHPKMKMGKVQHEHYSKHLLLDLSGFRQHESE